MNQKGSKKLDEKASNYILLYISPTNGIIYTEENKTLEEIRGIIFERNLAVEDYAVFKGEIVKNFM